MDTDTLRKITTVDERFLRMWLKYPDLWQTVYSEEEYLDTRVIELLIKHAHNVKHFNVMFKHEFAENKPLNHILFTMYNLVTLNVSGSEIIFNVDFLQIIPNVTHLDLSNCPTMSCASLIRSVNTMPNLKVFICRGNGVRVSAFSIDQAVRGLDSLEELDCSDTGTMHPYLARKLLYFCENVRKFRFTTMFSLDTDESKVSWYKLVKVKFPHVEFSQRIVDKVEEYMVECRSVRMEALLHDWVEQALEFNPEQY